MMWITFLNGTSTHARRLVAVFQVLCSLYGLTCVSYAQNSLEFIPCSPLTHVVGRSICPLRVDLRGLRSKLSWIRLTFSSNTHGRPEHLPLHRQTICSNWWFQWQMFFLVGGWTLKRRRNARCTAVANSVLMNSRKQKFLCCIVAILLGARRAL
jgi:hypothetical protein